eukprot:8552558-Lingulodinium_polyedra.AAC.1
MPRRPLATGDKLTILAGSSSNLGTLGSDTPSLITFDGGPRTVGGRKVAAGAAIAWVRQEHGWVRSATR